MPTSIIVHERIATWTGRLRPRFAGDPRVRWVESRSSPDLVAAVGSESSLVLIDLRGRTLWGMEGLSALEPRHHQALILVLDPDHVPEVPILARELGATLVWSGVVVPPRVATLFHHWLNLAETTRLTARQSNQPTR